MKIFSAVFLFFFAQFCFGQNNNLKDLFNPLSKNVAVTIEGGLTLGQTDYKDINLNYITNGSLEYYFFSKSASLLSIKGFGGIGIVSGEDNQRIPNIFNTTIYYAGAGLGYTYSINDEIYPYLSLGIASLWYYPEDKNGNKLPHTSNRQMGAYNSEIGMKFMVSKNVSLNISGNMILATQDYLDNIKSGLHNDAAFTVAAGLTYFFGRSKDSDGDNVPDYLDRCPGTLSCAKVDNVGCPLDSDGDGVPDYLDKCPNTPKGLKVDSVGCPLDSDKDGVPDYLDLCLHTPPGVKVDSSGYPLDSDDDGVPNYRDKCPNTPKGIQVDSNGCPLKLFEKNIGIRLRGDANFESGKSELLPGAYEILDSLSVMMKENPKSRWMVEGYTDSTGNDVINLKLSKMRAQSVVDYLVSKGVNRNSLLIKGFGKANPIASNDTVIGRAMNRRVEIKFITEGNK